MVQALCDRPGTGAVRPAGSSLRGALAEAALARKVSLDRAKKRGEREASAATEVRTTERALR